MFLVLKKVRMWAWYTFILFGSRQRSQHFLLNRRSHTDQEKQKRTSQRHKA